MKVTILTEKKKNNNNNKVTLVRPLRHIIIFSFTFSFFPFGWRPTTEMEHRHVCVGTGHKARFPNSRPCRYNRLCRFKFLEATGTIIWKRSSDYPRRSRDDPYDRNDQSSEIDSSSILATETTGKNSQAIAYF